MLGGGGIGEHEGSAVTGGGGMEEQASAVSGGGGTDELDASAVAGGGGIGEHEASAVFGGGGMAEHEASAVTAAAGLRNSPAPYSVAAGYLILNGPGGEPWPTRLCSHRTPYPYSAAEGLSGHCPGGKNHRPRTPGPSLPAPRPRTARLPALCRTGSPARSIPACSPALPADGPAVQPGGIAGHLARAAGEVIASPRQVIARSVRWRERDKPRKQPAICQVTSLSPDVGGLTTAWPHLMVTAWRLYGTRYPPSIWRESCP